MTAQHRTSHTDAHDAVIIREDSLACVIRRALVAVVDFSTQSWNAYTHAKWPIIRLKFLAEAWALVAHLKVLVTVLAAGCPRIARAGDAAALIAVATARSQDCMMKVMT
jgi:hypothetical protein